GVLHVRGLPGGIKRRGKNKVHEHQRRAVPKITFGAILLPTSAVRRSLGIKQINISVQSEIFVQADSKQTFFTAVRYGNIERRRSRIHSVIPNRNAPRSEERRV